ncbi:MAG: hypothetical protein ACFCVC_08245 [Acidimicrobiia bacterium]
MAHLSDPRLRAAALATSLWLFGVFTTLLLVGVWGRTVTADRPTLTHSTELLLASDLVRDRVEAWLTDGLVGSSAAAPDQIEGVLALIATSPEMDTALRLAAEEAVSSALAPPGAAPTVDLEPAAAALVPAVSRALTTTGMDVAPELVRAALADADLELSSGSGSWASGAAHRAGTALTRVLVVGLAGMGATGAIAIASSEQRVARVRSLAWRVALSSVTFALMLRLGSWAVHPTGGRSPVTGAASIIIGSNGHVPLLLAAGAAAVALLARRRHRRLHLRGVGDVSPPAIRT